MQKKISLIAQETPIVRLREPVGDTAIYMKRDDLIDFYFGGNKVRLYEYIAAKILEEKAARIVSFGSIHSNHLRVTAAIAAYLGLPCDLIVLHNDEEFGGGGSGNSILIDLLNANIHPCPLSKAHDFIDEFLESKANENAFFVPGGGHLPEGALGYTDAMRSIAREAPVHFDAIFLPTGTGTTHAGLLYGAKRLNYGCDIIGVTVARDTKRCNTVIAKLLGEMNNMESTYYEFADGEIVVLSNESIPYGHICSTVLETMEMLARVDGIPVDPIYNAKSFWRMKNTCMRQKTAITKMFST